VWTAIQWALNAAFVANPIGLIVLAVIALIAILVVLFKKNETFRKIVLAVWDAIKVAIGAVVDWLKNTAWPIIQAVWKGIVEGAKWLWGWIKKIWSAIVGSIMFYVDILKKIWATIAPAVKAAFDLVVSIIKTAWTVISAIFAVFVAIMKVTVIPIFHALWLVVSTVFGAILAIVKAVWGFIEPYIIESLQEVLAMVKAVWGFIGPYVIKWVQEVWAMIQKIWGLIVSATSTAFNTVWNVIKMVWDFIVNAVRNGVAIIVAVFNGIKTIVDKVRTFFGQLKAAAEGGVGSLFNFVKGIPGKILDAIGNLGKLLYNAGRNIIQGLIDGLKSMLSSLANTASNVMSTIRDYLPFSPAKKGPFSGKGWTLYSGQALITDFARGITMNAEVPQVALEGSLATVAASLDVSSAPVAPASTTGNAVPVAINVQGVWDFTDPSKTRVMVATLNDELSRYQKGYQ
jgi:phage-related protein